MILESFWKTALQVGIHLVKQLVSIENYKNVCPVLIVYEFNVFLQNEQVY